MIRYYFTILLSVVLLFCSSKKNSVKEGDSALLFSTMDYSGKIVTLKNLKGKHILLHFWADWCSECRAEFPKLEKAYQKYKMYNFEIIAINVGQSKNHVQSFVDKFNLTFPMLLDEQSEIAKQYGIRGLPTNFFIDEDMVVTKMIIGWVDEKQIDQIIHNGNTK
jgi:peroxiredoxin